MSEPQWVWQCDHVIPGETPAGRRILAEILTELQDRDWGRHDIFAVHLATEEALVNAIRHGNRYDPAKQVRIRCGIAAEVIRIEIMDDGPGFHPDELPDPTDSEHLGTPTGRGVLLIRSFMSRVEFRSPGNHVILEKDRNRSE